MDAKPATPDEARDRVVAGQVEAFTWQSGRAVRYEVAVEALNRAIGVEAAKLRSALLRDDETAAADARKALSLIARRQETLHPEDVQAVESAIADGYRAAGGSVPSRRPALGAPRR